MVLSNTYLNRLGHSPALPILDILTTLLRDIVTFLTGDLLVSCLLLLTAILNWLLGALLGAHRFIDSFLNVPTLLLRNAATALLLAGASRLALHLRLLQSNLGASKEAKLEMTKTKHLMG